MRKGETETGQKVGHAGQRESVKRVDRKTGEEMHPKAGGHAVSDRGMCL